MKFLVVCVFAVLAIGFAEDVKKDKRSVNDVQIGYQPVSEEQAALAQYAGDFGGAQVIEQPAAVTVVAGHQGVPEQAIQIAQEALPVVQQALQAPFVNQEVIPIQEQAVQYAQEALPLPAIQEQAIPIQQEAIQYSPQPLAYAAPPVQYAPEELQAVQSPPVPTVERTVYKTTHVDRFVPQPYPVEVVKHIAHPIIVDRPVPRPYPVYLRPSKTVILTGRDNAVSNLFNNLLGRSNNRPVYSSLLQSLFARDSSSNGRYPSATSPEELVAIGRSLGFIKNYDEPGFIVRRFKKLEKDF